MTGAFPRRDALTSDALTLIIDTPDDGMPRIIYAGPGGDDVPEPEAAVSAAMPPVLKGAADASERPPIIVTPRHGSGFSSGLKCHRAGVPGDTSFVPNLVLKHAMKDLDGSLIFILEDAAAGLELIAKYCIRRGGHDYAASTSVLTNHSETPLVVDKVSVPAILISDRYTHAATWRGRWTREFQRDVRPLAGDGLYIENTVGITGHNRFPGVLLGTEPGIRSGPAFQAHLAASGNWWMQIEEAPNGDRLLTGGQAFLPGELILQAGEKYLTPWLLASETEAGAADLVHRYHSASLGLAGLSVASEKEQRPVHYNTWEAVYFDHDMARLKDLATKAAELGAERFVLDDGWFRGRNDDTSSLGDWVIDEDKYPDGFAPLVTHLQGLGLEFGLWVEPEMVSENSDLYRAHPEWAMVLHDRPVQRGRGQLVLNLAIPDVIDHLFGQISALLSAYPVTYVKWDMNRLYREAAGSGFDRPVARDQDIGRKALMARLKEAHPHVSIESCASGGGRMNFDILELCDRFWLSDNNDTHERWPVFLEAAQFFSPRLLGFHVGPSPGHTSGRQLSMTFRALSAAVTGHMGLELDISALGAVDEDILKRAIAFHKGWREHLLKSAWTRLTFSDPAFDGFISHDGDTGTFLAAVVQLEPLKWTAPPRLRLPGLKDGSRYQVDIAFRDLMDLNWAREYPAPLINGPQTLDAFTLSKSGLQILPGWADQILILTGKLLK